MTLSTFRHATLIAALVAIGATLTQPAEGGPMRLRVESVGGGVGVVITDNLAGDESPLAGVIVFSGAVGAFPVTVTSGTSNSPGGPTFSELDLNNVSVLSSGSGTLRITLEDDSYTSAAHKLLGSLGGVLQAPPGSTITLNSWVNPDSLVPDLGPDLSPAGPLAAIGAIPAGSIDAFGPGFTSGPGAFAASSRAPFPEDSSYSLFAQAAIVFTGPGTISFDEVQRAVPLPDTLLLTLLALPMIALARRRRAS